MTTPERPRLQDIDPASLVPLPPETKLAVMPYLLEQLVPLLKADRQGMVVARNPEEEAILGQIEATASPDSQSAVNLAEPVQPRVHPRLSPCPGVPEDPRHAA